MSSILDNDLYKFTMMQAVWELFPTATVKYEFKCRNNDIKFTKADCENIRFNIENMHDKPFYGGELSYLHSLNLFKNDFLNFLDKFKLNTRCVKINLKNGKLDISIIGNWVDTILLEVPILYIVNEVWSERQNIKNYAKIRAENVDKKINFLKRIKDKTFKFSDYGTRRRFSEETQAYVCIRFRDELPYNFVGTSNVNFAYQLDIPCMGTMAHEWIMAGQALDTNLRNSQRYMLQKWADVYRGKLGIALSDTLGFDTFLKDFDGYFARLYDGCRQDSGDPKEWFDKLLNHYKKLGIDPKTKKCIFSDGLDIQTAYKLHKYINGRMIDSYGIGTNLTNDCGLKPIQIVIKTVRTNNQPVAKLSDTKGKLMCKDELYLTYLKKVFDIK